MKISKIYKTLALFLAISFAHAGTSPDRTICPTLLKPRSVATSVSQSDSLKAVMDAITSTPVNLPLATVRKIATSQDEINSKLKDLLENVIQSRAPPAGFFQEIPSEFRHPLTLKLLKAIAIDGDSTTAFISQIPPIPGCREAVIEHLRTSHLFTDSQVRTMFSGDRWKKFFPGRNPLSENEGADTQLIATVSDGLDNAWFQKNAILSDSLAGIEGAFGFRPVRSYKDFNWLISDLNIDKIPATDQVRGLIIQGYYEKNGRTLFDTNARRGAGQVEQQVPTMNRGVEISLYNGDLLREPPLIRQLFSRTWTFDQIHSLIESIRQRAIEVADIDEGYWNIRVGIHNFPTQYWVNESKVYFEKSKNPKVKSALAPLIEEMERFLGLRANGGSFDDILKDLTRTVSKLNPEELKKLQELAHAINEGSFHQKMLKSRETLNLWGELKGRNSYDDRRQINYWSGQRKILEFRMAELVKELDHLPLSTPKQALKTSTTYLPELFDSLEMENFLESGVRKRVEGMLSSILSDTTLAPTRKLELYNSVLQNLLDRIYYSVQDEFARFEAPFHQAFGGNTPRFSDALFRSTTPFVLGKYVDALQESLAKMRKIVHRVDGKEFRGTIEVFNPGDAVGILRIGKNPMSLTADEISVLSEMPTEMNACAGIVTLGSGARLSHVNLLAKALGVPNVKATTELLPELKELDGKWVRLTADKTGAISIVRAAEKAKGGIARTAIKVPTPNLKVRKPVRFSDASKWADLGIAGPKGTNLARAFSHPKLKAYSEDGMILPFGYFDEYMKRTGLKSWLDVLAETKLENHNLVALLSGKIASAIEANPIPTDLLEQALVEMRALKKRTGNELGDFFRSDTNLEDLPGFNGAGLNATVGNIALTPETVDRAIREVWTSAFHEKSITWRGAAVGGEFVPVAYPSVVIMPTVRAKNSGVLISKGGKGWKAGQGLLSANYGIGSVVEADRPVEEYTFETGKALRFAMSVSNERPVAAADGGLVREAIKFPKYVLTLKEVEELRNFGNLVESSFGDLPYGWDIEWAYDAKGRLRFLQSRPNMGPKQ